jgi:hypothetical protein
VDTNNVPDKAEVTSKSTEVPVAAQPAEVHVAPTNSEAPKTAEFVNAEEEQGPTVPVQFSVIACPSPEVSQFDSTVAPVSVQVDSSAAVLPEPYNATAQAPVSTRATRSQQVRPTKATEEEKKLWTYDAGEYLRASLAKFGGDKLAGLFRDFENALGNPIGKVCVILMRMSH